MNAPPRRLCHGALGLMVAAAALAGPSVRGDIPPIDGDPTVRFAYVIPSNRSPQPNGVAHFQETVLLVHAWYGEQMSRWGFGYQSFRYETDEDGVTPLIHMINVAETDAELRGESALDLWGNTSSAAYNAGATSLGYPGEIWILIPETHVQQADSSILGGICLGGGGALYGNGSPGDRNGRAMIGSDMLPFMGLSDLQQDTPYQGLMVPEIGPYPLRYGVTWHEMLGSTISRVASSNTGALAHELAHGFGLYHDFRNDVNARGVLMGNGLRGFCGWALPQQFPENVMRLSYAAAMSVNTLPYFTVFEPGPPPARSGPPGDGTGSSRPADSPGGEPDPASGLPTLRIGPTADDTPKPFPLEPPPPGKDTPPLRDDRDDIWPTLTVRTYGNVDPVDGHILIDFDAGDNEGLACAVLRLRGNTIGEMPLSGTQVSETFVTPYRDGNYYDPGEPHAYRITVYDLSGNAANVTTYITPGTGFNYAPLPFVRTLPASEVRVGQPVVIDAAASSDLNDETYSLLVEWDLDGDGVFDTSPTNDKTLATVFPAPGIQFISARVTDPAGAQTVSTPIAFRVFVTGDDCNENGIPDECDIIDATSTDCNANWIPDECEPDCNGNGVTDECDIRDGTSADCNRNGVPDECDIADGASVDDNGNGVPDECELPVRYVDADAPADGNGLFWASAFNNLQDALDSAAASGGYVTEIWVAAGTYMPAGPGGERSASFQLLNGVALCGGFAGDETSRNQRAPGTNVTILSGDLNGNDGPGFASTDENSYHVVRASGCDETAILDGFTITGGNASVSSYPNGWGGGMYTQNGGPTVSNCAFVANRAGYLGGGMFNDQSSPALINCTFRGNRADNHGGGIYSYRSAVVLANCLFDGNESESRGGGVYNSRGSATLTNCTFSHNAADYGGAVHCENNSDVTIANCILWGDSAGHGPEIALTGGYGPSTVAVSYSDVAGGAPAVYVASGCTLNWGDGNLDADPRFVDPDGPDNDGSTWADNDLHLAAASPCVDAGDPALVPAPDERDIDGQVRVWDGDNDGERRVDMGSDEFGSRLPGDLDGDGDVDLVDLAQLLAHYGTAADANWDDGDLDADGDVDLADLAVLLAVYGTVCD